VGDGPAWLPDGSVNPAATGILLSDIDLGLVIVTGPAGGGYAFSGLGTVSFLGLPGLDLTNDTAISPRFGLALNRTGAPITRVIPGVPDPLTFASGADLPVFRGGGAIEVPGAFRLSGLVSVRRMPAGQVDIVVENASLQIAPGATEADTAFTISGRASFTVGGPEGFRLQDLRMNQLKIFGEGLTLGSTVTNRRRRPTSGGALQQRCHRSQCAQQPVSSTWCSMTSTVAWTRRRSSTRAARRRTSSASWRRTAAACCRRAPSSSPGWSVRGTTYRYHFDPAQTLPTPSTSSSSRPAVDSLAISAC
jgi:hypothetical protein